MQSNWLSILGVEAMNKLGIKKYEFIDALRGLAILGVIFTHSAVVVVPSSVMLQWFASEGARGVQLFYIASALTLCMSWAARRSHEIFPIRNFFIRRFFRIAPMFYFAILLYICVNGFSPASEAPNGVKWWFIPVTALFLHGFHPETINGIVRGGWSIAVEMMFYLILPFLMFYIKTIKSCVIFFMVSVVLYGFNKFIVVNLFYYPENQQDLVENFAFFNFLGQLPVFFIGIFCYLIFLRNYSGKLVAIVGGSLFVALLGLFINPVFKFLPQVFKFLPHHMVAGMLFSVFALILGRWPVRFFVNRITTMLGKISFSMYLVHFAILTAFSRLGFTSFVPKSDLGSLLHVLCVIFVAAFASSFSYKYIERPGMALGKRLIEKAEETVVLASNVAVNAGDAGALKGS
jgi:peptidoglycan/LPS O-acetylase OafA/YrhL